MGIGGIGMSGIAQVLLEMLSGGERQLAGVARVLAQGAGLALLDEPTTGLDFGNQSVVLERIADLRARGLAVVFSTHDPRHVAACADRVLMLERDGACELVPVAAALDAARLERVYGVPVRL